MARLAALLTLVALLVPATAAVAQDNPFSPLPPPAATSTPVPTATPDTSSNSTTDQTGVNTLYLIGGALLVAFVAIGVWIARDARRSIPEHHRGRHMMAEPAPGEPRERRRDPKTKARARQKTRAQRQARKHNRPRSR
jgi:hypothetical protein